MAKVHPFQKCIYRSFKSLKRLVVMLFVCPLG